MQNDCVLVGLDWAELMIQFLLHVTCSSIPHAYVLYFQYTCYIWNVLGLFWLSLSLPLVLFTLVVSMATKCKSASSWNPLRSGALSLSDPTPSSIQFCDEDAWKDFSETFSQWGVHSECWIILTDYSDTDLQYLSFILSFKVCALLSHQSWYLMCSMFRG